MAAGCLWPQHAPYHYEMFCLRCRVPPKEIKAFCWRSAEFELSPERSVVAVLVLLGSNWKSEGFLTQGHSDIAMVIEQQAPESRSCGGTPRPFLLLVCNFSKYSPSRTPSRKRERAQETATALNPFPHQAQPRCPRQNAQRATPFCLGTSAFGAKTPFPAAQEAASCVTQLFLNRRVYFACLFPVQAVPGESCYSAGSVFINQPGS